MVVDGVEGVIFVQQPGTENRLEMFALLWMGVLGLHCQGSSSNVQQLQRPIIIRTSFVCVF